MQRYLAILRQLGLLVTAVFLSGYVLAHIFPINIFPINVTVESVLTGIFILIAGLFVTYYLFDRLIRVVLGSKYRPEEEMQEWAKREATGWHGLKGFSKVLIAFAVLMLVSMYLDL